MAASLCPARLGAVSDHGSVLDGLVRPPPENIRRRGERKDRQRRVGIHADVRIPSRVSFLSLDGRPDGDPVDRAGKRALCGPATQGGLEPRLGKCCEPGQSSKSRILFGYREAGATHLLRDVFELRQPVPDVQLRLLIVDVDAGPCRPTRAAAQKPLARRHHPHRDVALAIYAAPGRTGATSAAASDSLPWRAPNYGPRSLRACASASRRPAITTRQPRILKRPRA